MNKGFTLMELNGEVEIIGKNTNVPTKIEELIDWYSTTNDEKSNEMLMHILWNKLNEVIREFNRRSE